MPGLQLPRAAFEPISPDLDLAALVETTPNFEFVVRIHCDAIDEQGIENFEKLIQLHVVLGGKPLVVEGYQDRLEKWIFSLQWLKDNHGTKVENARDLARKCNLPLTIQHYLKSMAGLTSQWNKTNYKDANRQRIYLKDIDCPAVWQEKLKTLLPPFLYYLNDATGKEKNEATKAGDLMSSLPSEMRAENLMCYIGHEGTYTPSHREMCATLGHNIMVETSSGSVEDGISTKPGSSIWFMTETKDRHLVSEYWRSTLGHDIEIEDHFAQINAWKSAPFKTYVVEQKVGDLILIPPLAPHQVWNRGIRTMKVAWNRTTIETLEMAINEALPRARLVCRDEQYKNKAIVYFTLEKYSNLLNISTSTKRSSKIRTLQKDFKRLFSLYTQILLSESFSRTSEPRNVEFIPFSSDITCSYCRCNIFNRFLTCPSCIGKLPNGEDDNYDICMECYALGRSCACISKLKWVEQFRWKDLIQEHERWRNQILQFQERAEDSALLQPLLEQQGLNKKFTVAEICQEELKRRPWTDISKPETRENEPNDDTKERKRKRRNRISQGEGHGRCHVCTTHPSWKLATCTNCRLRYCYGSLYRAFDMSPLSVLEQLDWKCPKCLKVCSCGACRRDPTMKPFAPAGTRLGHDTKKVADPRSVESLVDFSYSNLMWLKKIGDHPKDSQDSRRMRQIIEEAELAKQSDPVLDDHDIGQDESEAFGSVEQTRSEQPPIDPALMAPSPKDNQAEFVVPRNAVFCENMSDRYEATEAITFEYPNPGGISQKEPVPDLHAQGLQLFPAVNGSPSFDFGGTAKRSTTIVHSDVLPIDLGLDPGHSTKKSTPAVEDEDFAPDKRLYHHAQPGSRNVITRQSQQRLFNSKEPDLPNDQQRQGIQRQASRKISKRHKKNRDSSDYPTLTNQKEKRNVSEVTSNTIEHDCSDQEITAPSQSEPATTNQRPDQLTQSEQNKRAKLMALRWAQGDTDHMDEW